MYEQDPARPGADRKRGREARDGIFRSILSRRGWILEDAGRKCFEQGFREADRILLLEPPARVRRFRILRRWVRQRMGAEPCRYVPDPAMLLRMFRWSAGYDAGADGLKKRLEPYREKVLVLRTGREMREFPNRFYKIL